MKNTDFKFNKSIVADQVVDYSKINVPTTLVNPSFLVHLAFEGIEKEEEIRVYINDLVGWMNTKSYIDLFLPIDGKRNKCGNWVKFLAGNTNKSYNFLDLFHQDVITKSIISEYLNTKPTVSKP